jgi:ADP-ribose pyrophosphatase YjhB (NUDIX family)
VTEAGRGSLGGFAAELVDAVATYARLGWWGLVAPRWIEARPLVVLQGVVVGEGGILLAVRSDLRGWELPGGTPEADEVLEAALVREIAEETGVDVEIDRHVGDYERGGFRPHTAKVYRCRPVGGRLRTSSETRLVRWFDPTRLPETLFPWYCQPIADALQRDRGAVLRRERHGLASVLAGLSIDLRMRGSGDRAGLRD